MQSRSEMHDKVLELFLDLDANEEQFGAPFLYGSAKNGYADVTPNTEAPDMTPLFKTIMSEIPAPVVDPDAGFKMLVSNIDWSGLRRTNCDWKNSFGQSNRRRHRLASPGGRKTSARQDQQGFRVQRTRHQ
jgi:hypothetical protein